jgi:tetratricopeptide (TPR) repeat protein
MNFTLKIFFIAFFGFSFSLAQVQQQVPAQAKSNNDVIISKAVELYNKRNYQAVIDLLEKNKNIRDENVNWYYYYGLNLGRLDRYEEAIFNLDQFIRRTDITSSARAFYFIGLLHFYKGNYEKAMNNLDVSLDISKDAKLDKAVDALIDKVTRYQNYYENRKPTNLSFLLGYNYDLNATNLSQELSQERLEGHIFNYGFSVAHRLIDTLSFVLEPSLTITDAYTLDSKLKVNSVLQEGDVLQGTLTIPVVFNTDKERSNSQYEVSVNAYTAFAPVVSNKRQQYVSSYYLKGRVTTDISAMWNLTLSAVAAIDQSVIFLNEESKSNGNRGEFELSLNRYLNQEKNTGLDFDLIAITKGATGQDVRYSKYGLAIGYWFPSFHETVSVVRLNQGFLSYPDRTVARRDNKLNLDYYLSQAVLEETAVLSYSLGFEKNTSNYEVNTYHDFKVGVAFTKQFGF